MWATAIILLVSCAFFTLAEIAFTSCDMIKLRGWSSVKREEDFTYRFLKNPERFLSTVLVGTNISMIALSVLASNIFSSQPWMKGFSPLILTFCVLIFAEIIPKGIAYRFALRISLVLSKPFTLLYWIFFPIISLVTITARGILKVFKISVNGEKPLLKEEEVRVAMTGLPLQEKKLILRMLDFSDKQVEEVMIPRNRIVAVPSDVSLTELVDIAIKSGHSRIPVYERNLDKIVGFVRVKEVITNYLREEAGGKPQKNDNKWLSKALHKCMFVPPYKRIEELMEEMKKEYRYIAIVKDEYGGTAGLITLEDILEELFGEIRDEYDFLEPDIEKSGEVYIVNGETDLDELRYELGVDIEERGTVASLILSRLKTLPKIGEKIVFNWGTLEVITIHRRKIDKVKITKKKT